jgi:diguanylate cyclase (GGDEF)-like protein/PAS domain S-box-containing protein
MVNKRNPLEIFLLLLVFVFFGELGVMYLLDVVQHKLEMNWLEAFVDASLLTSMCVPFFWYFIVKPLQYSLQLESTKSHKILEMAADGIVTIDTKGRIQSFNLAAQKIFGYSEEEVLQKNVSILMPSPHREAHDAHMERYLKTGRSHIFGLTREFEGVRHDGKLFPMELAISEIRTGNTRLFTGMIRDISGQKLAQQRIKHLAHFDTLTHLPNRSLFFDRLGQAISVAKRNYRSLAVLYMDLDGFKNVNDTLGHHFGDLLLVKVAERMGMNVRESDTLARLGGDEFTLILNDVQEDDAVATVAKKIIESISVPFNLEGHIVNIGVSVGIARYPNDANSSSSLLIAADRAMYAAKESGKNGFRFGETVGETTTAFPALDRGK